MTLDTWWMDTLLLDDSLDGLLIALNPRRMNILPLNGSLHEILRGLMDWYFIFGWQITLDRWALYLWVTNWMLQCTRFMPYEYVAIALDTWWLGTWIDRYCTFGGLIHCTIYSIQWTYLFVDHRNESWLPQSPSRSYLQQSSISLVRVAWRRQFSK